MTILKKELKSSFKGLCVWTLVIAFMLVICIIMFPQLKTQMGSVTKMFENMGSFTEAFGINKVGMDTLLGFYAIECGNMLGIGGAFFAAFIGISVLAKEEKDRTAEFLLTHPISRFSVLSQKLLSIIIQIVILNVVCTGTTIGSIAIIGEEIAFKEIMLIGLAYLIMQIQIACICFGISAFVKRGNTGVGLGIAAILYFAIIISNISEKVDFLRYITPFSYADAPNVATNGSIDIKFLLIGIATSLVFVITGYIKYIKKDIAS